MNCKMLICLMIGFCLNFSIAFAHEELSEDTTQTLTMYSIQDQELWPIQTEVVPINHLAPQQILNLLAKNPLIEHLAIDERSNSLSITGPWPIIEAAKSLIRSIDIPKPRIIIEGMVIDTSNINLQDRASQLTLDLDSKFNTVSFAGSVFGFIDPATGETLLALAWLDAHDRLKTLSRPKVAVTSGETAQISIGRDVYVPYYTPFGTAAPPAKIEPIQTGNRLRVTPRVIEDGKIQVSVEAESSEIAGTGPAGFPIVYRRSAISPALEVYDGETIIIGGLSSSTEYRYYGKFPILGDLPLIGSLFRSSRRRTEKQDVTILVTLRIIEPWEISEEVEPDQTESVD